MKKELDEELCRKYPKIFADRFEDMKTTAMCWGFECSSGWHFIIDTCCQHIQSYIDNNAHLDIPQVVATQVKEKFGTLRFYYDGGNEYIDGIVSHTEYLSEFYCEECGTTNEVGLTAGWYKTICKKCWIDEKTNLKFWKYDEKTFQKDINGNVKQIEYNEE